jgi:EAL domain-containing protein (putative c-di-GMP-specific phosphodiesterase class I)
MNVNVSAWQFLHGDLVGIVASCLASSGLPAERLELEITEGTALSDSADVQKSLDGLKELGVRIAIDDFGIGYSSLGIIDRMSVHSLKIDKLFVSQMVARPQSRAIVGTIIGLARFLNLLVVAEGVESVDQLAALGELDCAEAQGYLLSRAVTPDEIARLATESWTCDPADRPTSPEPRFRRDRVRTPPPARTPDPGALPVGSTRSCA